MGVVEGVGTGVADGTAGSVVPVPDGGSEETAGAVSAGVGGLGVPGVASGSEPSERAGGSSGSALAEGAGVSEGSGGTYRLELKASR